MTKVKEKSAKATGLGRIVKKLRLQLLDKNDSQKLWKIHASAGDASRSAKKWKEAAQHYDKALALDPSLTKVWIKLGQTHRARSKFELAEKSYLRALDIEPDNADALLYLAAVREKLSGIHSGELADSESASVNPVPDPLHSKAEQASPAAEPLSFRFHPKNTVISCPRLADIAGSPARPSLLLSGQAIGTIDLETENGRTIFATARAFQTITRKNAGADLRLCYGSEELPSTAMEADFAFGLNDDLTVSFATSTGVELLDIWFVHERALRLRFDSRDMDQHPCLLRCFQHDVSVKDGLRLLSETPLSPDMPTLVDINGAIPYLPLLVAISSLEGELHSLLLLPFPSLCRGGIHYGELVATSEGEPYLQALQNVSTRLLFPWLNRSGLPALSSIVVDLDEATGNQRIFRAAVRRWLGDSLGISVRSGHIPADTNADIVAYLEETLRLNKVLAVTGNGAILHIPADAVPSLHALMMDWDGSTQRRECAFILATAAGGAAQWVVFPPSGQSLPASQFAKSREFPEIESGFTGSSNDGPASGRASNSFPAAIRTRHLPGENEAQLLAPFAPATSVSSLVQTSSPRLGLTVSAIHNFSGDHNFLGAMLQALALQQDAAELQVIITAPQADAAAVQQKLADIFPDRGRVVICDTTDGEGARLNRAAAMADHDLLLIIGDNIILHDNRSIAVLSAVLAMPRIASASCMLVGPRTPAKLKKIGFVSSGYLAKYTAPGKLDEPVAEDLSLLLNFSPNVWPVALNSSRLFMVHNNTWQRLGGFADEREPDEEIGTAFWSKAGAERLTHVVSTTISATLVPGGDTVVDVVKPAAEFLPTVAAISGSLKVQRIVT